MAEPHVSDLARQLTECLRRSERQVEALPSDPSQARRERPASGPGVWRPAPNVHSKVS
jgi:hypothetical protein